MVTSFYFEAESEAYEMLHIQTKQIKDDLTLQLKSDKENLITMANFAAKLNAVGMSYDIMFDSFKPIGLFSRIGILTPDEVFITKDEVIERAKEQLEMEICKRLAAGAVKTGEELTYSKNRNKYTVLLKMNFTENIGIKIPQEE